MLLPPMLRTEQTSELYLPQLTRFVRSVLRLGEQTLSIALACLVQGIDCPCFSGLRPCSGLCAELHKEGLCVPLFAPLLLRSV
jgi:hypothetical protein